MRHLLGDDRYFLFPTQNLAFELIFHGKENLRLHRSSKRNFIVTGDLSSHVIPFAAHQTAQEVGQVMAAGLDYRATEIYADMVESAEHGTLKGWLGRPRRTTAAVDAYFDYIVCLIHSIERYGVLSRRHLGDEHRRMLPDYAIKRNREFDIGCTVGPNGEVWMFRSGHHRLAVAFGLGIPEVPVEVHAVHWQWIRQRGGCLRSGVTSVE